MSKYYANDKYNAELSQGYVPGQQTLFVTAVPKNVPTIIIAFKGTTKETVFAITGKTINSLTGVSRIRGANVELDMGTPVTCLNNEEFINQFMNLTGMNYKGEWSEDEDYIVDDWVKYLGSAYFCKMSPLSHEPPTDTDFWDLIVSKGDTGSSIVSVEFDGDDMVFTKDDDTTVRLENARIALKGEKGDPGAVDYESLIETTFVEDTENTDDYEADFLVTPTLEIGLKVNLKVTNANTGASTLNINSLGAKSIKKNVVDDLEAEDIKDGQIVPLIYDGNNFQIVGGGGGGDATSLNGYSATQITPIGSILPYAGLTAPSQFLICNGQAISRDDYSDLFEVIGTTYGIGDGSTTFNIPNLESRVPVGKSSETEFDTLGKSGGSNTHTLTINEMPSHNHNRIRALADSQTLYTGGSVDSTVNQIGVKNNTGATSSTYKDPLYTNYAGGGLAHNILQPYLTISYIIRY